MPRLFLVSFLVNLDLGQYGQNGQNRRLENPIETGT